jgi:hypothetical protein
VASGDFESSEYDLGVTSVRLIRAGNVVQAVFNRKQAAVVFYGEVSARFKRDEEGWKAR